MWKKHGSSLNKGHYFVLAPLGGIGSCFRAGKLVGVALAHVLEAVLMNSRDLCLGRLSNVYAKSAFRQAKYLGWCGNRRLRSAIGTIEDS